jgi:hypothetical protein
MRDTSLKEYTRRLVVVAWRMRREDAGSVMQLSYWHFTESGMEDKEQERLRETVLAELERRRHVDRENDDVAPKHSHRQPAAERLRRHGKEKRSADSQDREFGSSTWPAR